MDVSDIRRLTPIPDDYAYFQTSGFSPKLEPVTEEVIRWLQYQNRGPALPAVLEQMNQMIEQVRAKVAKAINAEPDEITLNENTTVGINIVANGIDWRDGDNVILSTHEHPGNRIPWYNAAQRYGVQLRFVSATMEDKQLLDDLSRQIDERTRLVTISHVSRQSGRRFPARHIVDVAHDRGVPVLFDGAQAFGAIPVNVRALDCEFYTFSGHKYIMAPQATGGLFVRRDCLDRLIPSWLGAHSEVTMDLDGHMVLHDAAKRFEFGTRNHADQAGFGKALDIWDAIGWEPVFDRIEAYTHLTKNALKTVTGLVLETPMPWEKSSGIVTFRLPGLGGRWVADSLAEQEHVLTSPVGAGEASVRVSTHVFNTEAELRRLVAGVIRIQEGKRGRVFV